MGYFQLFDGLCRRKARELRRLKPGLENGAMAIARIIDEQVLGCRTVAFDEHALTRMGERGVTEDEVIDVLRYPDQTGLPTQPNRFRYRKSLGGRSVDVVFEHDPTQIVFTVIA